LPQSGIIVVYSGSEDEEGDPDARHI